MKTISGLFDSQAEARTAVDALEEAGVPSGDISIIGPHGEESASGAAAGAGVGAALGGAGGLLAGLVAFAIPGIGPVLGAGWLATTLIGAAAGGLAGGLIGSLTDAGIDERDAHVYAEGIRRGGNMVVARVDENEALWTADGRPSVQKGAGRYCSASGNIAVAISGNVWPPSTTMLWPVM